MGGTIIGASEVICRRYYFHAPGCEGRAALSRQTMTYNASAFNLCLGRFSIFFELENYLFRLRIYPRTSFVMADSAQMTKGIVEDPSLAAQIPIDEIPPTLRCGSCSKLSVNAFRLPCCDQRLCEACHLFEPKSCPVCEQEPLVAAECKPHKAVRMMVKAFLKSGEGQHLLHMAAERNAGVSSRLVASHTKK